MHAHRSTNKIVADLLYVTNEFGQEGIKTTTLLTKANLSHSRLSKFITNLTSAELLNKIEYDGKNTFVITEKGREYLESYTRFAEITESFGLNI